MGSPTIFKGARTGLLSSKGLSLKDGTIVDNDGVPNFIKNGHAEITADGWVTYADADQASPVDGTGGSPTVTWTRTTTTPLAGSGSFLFTKAGGSSSRGQGASYDFTVDPAYRARVVNIQFDYIVASGTFAAGTSSTDSDLTVWIYDVTNSTIIQPSSFRLLSNSSGIADTFQSSFQTSATGSSYRLIVHCSTTSASAYTVEFDNIQVAPTEYAFGTPVTDWQSYTPIISGLGTGTTTGVSFQYRRVGDSMQLMGRWAMSSAGSGSTIVRVSIPSGFSFDASKFNNDESMGLGAGNRLSGSARSPITVTSGASGIASTLTFVETGGGAFTGSILTLNSQVGFEAQVPILGWSSSVQMSDQTSTRVVDFVGSSTTGQSITANTTKFTFTAFKDSHSAWSTDTYTVPVAGDYSVSLSYYQTTSGAMAAYVHLNGANPGSGIAYLGVAGGSAGFAGSGTVILYNCKVGDAITIKGDATQTLSAGNRTLSISRIAGPNQIAASETVTVRAYNTSGQSIPNGTPTTITGWTENWDSHGAFDAATGIFTVPIAGKYRFSGNLNYASASYGVGVEYILLINNARVGNIFTQAAATSPVAVGGSDTFYFLAGATVAIRTFQTTGLSRNLLGADSSYCHIAIEKVGN